MPFFSQDFLESLSDKADIVDVISDYVTLKNSGRSYVGLCPFHREKTPSFHVDADKQLFHCFGCQAERKRIHVHNENRESGFCGGR